MAKRNEKIEKQMKEHKQLHQKTMEIIEEVKMSTKQQETKPEILLTLNYLTRICDTSELEKNCNELYNLGFETIIVSNEGQNKKLILSKRIK